MRLCEDECYEGDFLISRPITLEGNGAHLRGPYPQPQPEDCVYGLAPVLTVWSGGTVAIQDLTIFGGCAGSTGGGGLHVELSSDVGATNLVITGNASTDSGGGVAVDGTSPLHWGGGELTDSHAEYGGGAYADGDATLLIEGGLSDFLIDGNTSVIGGGIRGSATFSFVDTTISNNTAELYGGGVDAGIGSTVDFLDVTISGSTAGGGGGIDVYVTGTVDLVDSTLSNNSATTGGAVRTNGALSFDQVSLYGNTADDGNTVALRGESASFTYTIAPGGNGDATSTIYCNTSGNEYATTDPYTVCDDELCTP